MFDFNLDDLFNAIDMPLDWDKKAYMFNRDEKDMHPYSIVNLKDKTIITHNILGVDKKDLKLSLTRENGNAYILIEGKTIDELTKKTYSVSSRFAIDENQLDLSKISSTAKNGLLYITIPFKAKEELKNTTLKINID